MRRLLPTFRWLGVLVTILSLMLTTGQTHIAAQIDREVLKQGVVKVVARERPEGNVLDVGAGILVGTDDANLYVLTALHLVCLRPSSSANQCAAPVTPVGAVEVYLYRRFERLLAKRLQYYLSDLDVALIVVTAGPQDRTVCQKPLLRVADVSKLKEGEAAITIGHHGSYDWQITENSQILSLHEQLDTRKLLLAGVNVQAGSSGGPVFNRFGELVGLVTERRSLDTSAAARISDPLMWLDSLRAPRNCLDFREPTAIGVFPLREGTGVRFYGLGERVARAIAERLLEASKGREEIRFPEDLAKLLSYEAQQSPDSRRLTLAGWQSGSRLLVFGLVSQGEVNTTPGSLGGISGEVQTATLTATVQLLDVRSSQVVLSETAPGKATNLVVSLPGLPQIGKAKTSEELLADASRDLAARIVPRILEEAQRRR